MNHTRTKPEQKHHNNRHCLVVKLGREHYFTKHINSKMAVPGWSPPSRCSCAEIASIIVFVFAFLIGIGSFSATVVAWDDDYNDEYYYYDDDELTPAEIAAISLGAVSLILFIIAVPLAFAAGRAYLTSRNAVSSTNGVCLIGYSVAAWIIYGLGIIDGIAALAVGASPDGEVGAGFVASVVFVLVIGWALMLTYAELARRRQGEAIAHVEAQPPLYTVPATTAKAEPPGGRRIETKMVQHPDGTKTVTKTTFEADGSKVVEITEYGADDLEAGQ